MRPGTSVRTHKSPHGTGWVSFARQHSSRWSRRPHGTPRGGPPQGGRCPPRAGHPAWSQWVSARVCARVAALMCVVPRLLLWWWCIRHCRGLARACIAPLYACLSAFVGLCSVALCFLVSGLRRPPPPPPYTSRLVGCCGPPYLLYVTDYDLENRALSLIGKPGKKSLHLVCASADERAFWFEGLQGLVRPVACVSFVARSVCLVVVELA